MPLLSWFRKPVTAIPLVMAVILLTAVGVRLVREARAGSVPQKVIAVEGRTVPVFSLATLDGNGSLTEKTLAAQDISVINFFASWCSPCMMEWPHLLEIQKAGVPLYGISFHDSAANINKMLANKGNPFQTVGLDDKGTAAVGWGIRGVPETFVVDKNGRMLYHFRGVLDERYTAEILRLAGKS